MEIRQAESSDSRRDSMEFSAVPLQLERLNELVTSNAEMKTCVVLRLQYCTRTVETQVQICAQPQNLLDDLEPIIFIL